MWALTLWNQSIPPLPWGVVISATLAASVIDFYARRIPNWLTGPLFLGGLIWAGAVGGLAGVADGFAACLLLAFPFVLLFLFAGGGAGDAKLMGAIGAWLGLVNGVLALAAVCIVGALLGAALALAKKRFSEVLGNVGGVFRASLMVVASRGRLRSIDASVLQTEGTQTMPYGVAIFGGVSMAALGVFLWFA